MFYEEIRIKQCLFSHFILSIMVSLQQQIHFNGNIFGENDVVVTRVHCIDVSVAVITRITHACNMRKNNNIIYNKETSTNIK